MRKLAMLLLWCGLFARVNSYAQQAATWDLARDLQISFTQGSNGVWYFMESETRVHDPAVYRLLPRYLNPCQSPWTLSAKRVFAGVGCWQGTEAHTPGRGGFGLKTEVAFNFTNKRVYGTELGPYLPHTVFLLPTWDRYAIVAWQSPITGVVNVTGWFAFLAFQPGGVGLNWSVDKGDHSLLAGHVFTGPDRAPINLPNLPVAKGDVLYFMTDNDWGCGLGALCQPIPLNFGVTITQVQ
jgi:hypothetical protein